MQLRNLIVRISTIATLTELTLGCEAIKPKSRVPEFICRLEKHSFSKDERIVIGDILHYVNELEAK
jgi:hypothetical protein